MIDASSLAIGLAVACPPQWLPVLMSFANLPDQSGTSPWDRCGASCSDEVWETDADTFIHVRAAHSNLSPGSHAFDLLLMTNL